MTCARCGEQATSEITDAHGVRCTCEACSDAFFVMLIQPSIEQFYSGGDHGSVSQDGP